MLTTKFVLKSFLLANLVLNGVVVAQNLPDEINHIEYYKVYQKMVSDLSTKTTTFEQLSIEKDKLNSEITRLEKDRVEIPVRNEELTRLINGKRQHLAKIESDIQGLEGVLSKLIEDLRKIDSMMAQLQKDLNEEGARSQAISGQSQAISQDVARFNARLQKEIQDENQSVQILSRHQNDIQGLTLNIQEKDQERRQLIVEVDRIKRDVVITRAQLNQSNQLLNSKKTQLTQTQSKLPGVKADIATNEAKLPGIDANLNPKLTQLTGLKNDLAARMPEVVKLEKENADLTAQIKTNKTKIDATEYTAKLARKATLEKEIADLNAKIKEIGDSIVSIKESMKPDLGREIAIREELKEAQRTNNQAQVQRLKAELEAIRNRLAPKRQDVLRLEKQLETSSIALVPKNNELSEVSTALPALEVQVTSLKQEITNAEAKIKANNVVITERQAANAGLIKEIADLETVINKLKTEKSQIQTTIASLRQTESALTTQIASLNAEISKLEKDVVAMSNNIVAMDKAIADFPMNNRRLELNIGKLNEMLVQKRNEALREQKLLERIRQDRMVAERDLSSAQSALTKVEQDLVQSQRLMGAISKKLQEEQAERDTLTRYNQDSVRKLDALKQQKTVAEKDIDGASKEIAINEQDLNTIATELPKQLTSLGIINPKVANAETSMNAAQAKTEEASTLYQNRLSLYQQHLSAAQSLGSERASVGSVDGDKAGRIDAKTQAVKMATENAATHGKWEALLRAYVRGEIAGYQSGFDLGMSSESDASRGDGEGKIAGARRAKDHANMVLKPEFYIEEMDRRLKEEEVPKRAGKIIINGEHLMKAMIGKNTLSALESDIPELTQEELNQSRQIVTALDSMIEQSSIEIKDILARRTSLSQARNAYAILTAGANAANPNCSGVYKNVKDFVDACKSMYNGRYQLLFGSAHNNAFQAEYGLTFKSQIDSTFGSELDRLYPGYLKEATNVGKQVGVANGQKEIFRQSFDRAEKASYAASLPGEEERVENESVNLVSEHLSRNAALTIKGNGKLTSNSVYGIAPGTQLSLSMIMKNIGEVPSLGDSVVKITEVSSNLVLERREAPVSSVAAKSAMNVEVMKITANENSVPGSRVVLAGQIIHPGNHYRANRVENFRIETMLEVNPALTTTFDYDNSPKVAGIFGGIKEHGIEVKVAPKFAGVQNYEVGLEEVGTNFVTVLTHPIQTGALNKGSTKKIDLNYKMSKAAKGKTLTLRVSVKHNSKVVESFDLKLESH